MDQQVVWLVHVCTTLTPSFAYFVNRFWFMLERDKCGLGLSIATCLCKAPEERPDQSRPIWLLSNSQTFVIQKYGRFFFPLETSRIKQEFVNNSGCTTILGVRSDSLVGVGRKLEHNPVDNYLAELSLDSWREYLNLLCRVLQNLDALYNSLYPEHHLPIQSASSRVFIPFIGQHFQSLSNFTFIQQASVFQVHMSVDIRWKHLFPPRAMLR